MTPSPDTHAHEPGQTLATLGGQLCPVCSQRVSPRVDVGDYQLFHCPACGCWCSDALFRRAHSSFSPDDYFANADVDRDKWEDLLGRLQAAGRPVGSVLEIGCGVGSFLSFLGTRFPGLGQTGIELDAERARRARAANPGARILVGDALDALAGVEGRFDLIALWDVFEHLPAPGAVLEALAERLEARGCIFIQTIHERSLVPTLGRLSYRLTGGRVRSLVRRTHEAHHLVFFSRPGLAHLATRARLEIREQWFDRLALARMDGNPLITATTSALLNLENALGNGLFVNAILARGAAL